MSKAVEVPIEALPLIRIQRTSLAKLSDKRAINRYQTLMAREFDSISSYLPKRCKSILDIGCGVGGLDVLLYRHYGSPDIWMMDGNGTDRPLYGYREVSDLYNREDVTRLMMEVNGINRFHLIEPDPGLRNPFDLIVSLRSWCYHYPVETYLDLVNENLRKVMILDVRSRAIERLSNHFEIKEICKIKSGVRVICE